MTSTILDPIAAALKTKASGLSVTPTVKAYKWAPPAAMLDKLPAAVIDMPEGDRVPPDLPEDHLGEKDWRTEWPVTFYFDFTTNAPTAQARAIEVIEAWVAAVDADQTLGGVVQEAKVVHFGPPAIHQDEPRPNIEFPTRVEILDFV